MRFSLQVTGDDLLFNLLQMFLFSVFKLQITFYVTVPVSYATVCLAATAHVQIETYDVLYIHMCTYIQTHFYMALLNSSLHQTLLFHFGVK